MFTIQNEFLEVAIKPKGAELDSLFNKKEKVEYMWNADPAFWPKKSPVLFPIVGALKDNGYYVDGQLYKMGRHGFARDMEFAVVEQTPSAIQFSLAAGQQTFPQYPFPFRFDIAYSLKENILETVYSVENAGNEEMYFSVGGHPAFKVPLSAGLSYNDYYLEFGKRKLRAGGLSPKTDSWSRHQFPYWKILRGLHLPKSFFSTMLWFLSNLHLKRLRFAPTKILTAFIFTLMGFRFWDSGRPKTQTFYA